MGARFTGWIPNATGNLSFSLIGQDGQPSVCEKFNFPIGDGRAVIVRQTRHVADNLFLRGRGNLHSGLRELDYTLVSRSSPFDGDDIGVLHGFIFIHAIAPIEIKGLNRDSVNSRRLAREAGSSALFAVAFRLYRTGRIEFRVPREFVNQEVQYGEGQTLDGGHSLRPLVAQCFYFIRDITHFHQHHSRFSDTLTTVWPADEPSLWIRETLYELYRRVLMLRRQHYPRGQEDALGLLGYISSFEHAIAEPFRKTELAAGRVPRVPFYNREALKESLAANLETKRRRRIQHNVVAAAVPAFFIAMLSLANGLYDQNSAKQIETFGRALGLLAAQPISASLAILRIWEWTYLILAMCGVLWIVNITGAFHPTEERWIKRLAQAVSVRGRLFASSAFWALFVAVVALIIWLFRLG